MQAPSRFQTEQQVREYFRPIDSKYYYLSYEQFCWVLPILPDFIKKINRGIVDMHLRYHNHVFESMTPYKWTPIVLLSLSRLVRLRSPTILFPVVWVYLFDAYFYNFFAWRQKDNVILNIRDCFRHKVIKKDNITKKLGLANNYASAVRIKERPEAPDKFIAFGDYSPRLYSCFGDGDKESGIYLTKSFQIYTFLRNFKTQSVKQILSHLKEQFHLFRRYNAERRAEKEKPGYLRYSLSDHRDIKDMLKIDVVNHSKVDEFTCQLEDEVTDMKEIWHYWRTGNFTNRRFKLYKFLRLKQNVLSEDQPEPRYSKIGGDFRNLFECPESHGVLQPHGNTTDYNKIIKEMSTARLKIRVDETTQQDFDELNTDDSNIRDQLQKRFKDAIEKHGKNKLIRPVNFGDYKSLKKIFVLWTVYEKGKSQYYWRIFIDDGLHKEKIKDKPDMDHIQQIQFHFRDQANFEFRIYTLEFLEKMHSLRQQIQNCQNDLKKIKTYGDATFIFLFSAPLFNNESATSANIRYLNAAKTISEVFREGSERWKAELRLEVFNDPEILSKVKSATILYIMIEVEGDKLCYEDKHGKRKTIDESEPSKKIHSKLKGIIIESNNPKRVKEYLQKWFQLSNVRCQLIDRGYNNSKRYNATDFKQYFSLSTQKLKQLKTITRKFVNKEYFDVCLEDPNATINKVITECCQKMYDNPYQGQNKVIYESIKYMNEWKSYKNNERCIINIYGGDGSGKEYLAKLVRYHCFLKKTARIEIDTDQYTIDQLEKKVNQETKKDDKKLQNLLMIIQNKLKFSEERDRQKYFYMLKLIHKLPASYRFIISLDRPSTNYLEIMINKKCSKDQSSVQITPSSPTKPNTSVHDLLEEKQPERQTPKISHQQSTEQDITVFLDYKIKDIRIESMSSEEIYKYFMQKLELSKFNKKGELRKEEEDTLPETLTQKQREYIQNYLIRAEEANQGLDVRQVQKMCKNFIEKIQKANKQNSLNKQNIIQIACGSDEKPVEKLPFRPNSTRNIQETMKRVHSSEFLKKGDPSKQKLFDNTLNNEFSLVSLYMETVRKVSSTPQKMEPGSQHIDESHWNDIQKWLQNQQNTKAADQIEVLNLCISLLVIKLNDKKSKSKKVYVFQKKLQKQDRDRIFVHLKEADTPKVKFLMLLCNLLRMQFELEQKASQNMSDSITTLDQEYQICQNLYRCFKENVRKMLRKYADEFQAILHFSIYCYYRQFAYYVSLYNKPKPYNLENAKNRCKPFRNNELSRHHEEILSVIKVLDAERCLMTVQTKINYSMRYLYEMSKASELLSILYNNKELPLQFLWDAYCKYSRNLFEKHEEVKPFGKLQKVVVDRIVKYVSGSQQYRSKEYILILIDRERCQLATQFKPQNCSFWRVVEQSEQRQKDFENIALVYSENSKTPLSQYQKQDYRKKPDKSSNKFIFSKQSKSECVSLYQCVRKGKIQFFNEYLSGKLSDWLKPMLYVRWKFEQVMEIQWKDQCELLMECMYKGEHELLMFIRSEKSLLVIRNDSRGEIKNDMLIEEFRSEDCKATIIVYGNQIPGLPGPSDS